MSELGRSIKVVVASCPLCFEDHEHHVQVRVIRAPSAQPAVMVFAGPSDEKPEDQEGLSAAIPDETCDVMLRCPNKHEKFPWTAKVAAKHGERIAGLIEARDRGSNADVDAELASALDQEFDQWVVGSAGTAREYCRTMLTAAFSAIPVFYAVLKYLSFPSVTGTVARLAGVIPPILFLVSAMVFVGALRPNFIPISKPDFAIQREERLTKMNRMIVLGTAVFVAGVLGSLASFQMAIMWKA